MNNRKSWPDRRAIWRWHFYAGLLCAPIVLWLAVTGSIYLFRTQIESAIDAPYANLDVSSPRPPSAQVEAAVAAVPGAHLSAYVLPQSPRAAVQVLVEDGDGKYRVYVHPQTLAVLKKVKEDDRFMRVVFRLHGELLMGNAGSAIVEMAACWAIVLILTGLILWWPNSSRLAGVLWPRLSLGKRVFWRDAHAVTGFWVSACALVLLTTGLPWAKFWGDYFKEIRQITHTADGPQDWANGAAKPAKAVADAGMEGMHGGHMHGGRMHGRPSAPFVAADMDRVVAAAQYLQLAPPVLISPPAKGADWKVRSDAANRPLRADAKINGATGAIANLRTFSQRHPIDQTIGYGVAVHEGKLFGAANLLVSLLTALGLMLLCASAMATWLQRRPPGVLGAPEILEKPRFSAALLAAVATLAVAFPLWGASLAVVWIVEFVLLRRIAPSRAWLGLTA